MKKQQADFDGALADCDQALSLAPDEVNVLLLRARIKQLKTDHEGGLADTERAVELASNMPDAHLECGEAHLLLRHWQEAQVECRHYCELAETEQEYPRYFIWIAQMRLSQKEAADRELSDYLNKLPSASRSLWKNVIGDFLLGKKTEGEFFAAAASPKPETDSQRHCEAWYYAGLKRLMTGEKNVAVDDFRQCLSTKEMTFMEYKLATVELASPMP